MNRVSVRTLVLLVQLLMVVTAYQYLACATPVRADVVWMDDEPEVPEDPNEPDDPMPEIAGQLSGRVWLDEEPEEPEEPAEPEEPEEPMPETA